MMLINLNMLYKLFTSLKQTIQINEGPLYYHKYVGQLYLTPTVQSR